MHRFTLSLSMFLCLLIAGVAAFAAITVPSDGSDGVFAPTADTVVDLSQATTATWDTPGTGNGVYDAVKWAVVFKYQSVTIPAGVTVSFNNHPSGAPVVWLVQGTVTIEGTLSLDGQDGAVYSKTFSVPGPGGFAGGRCGSGVAQDTAGLGPGGGQCGGGYWATGSYASQGDTQTGTTYGNSYLLPLIGGSGGSAGFGYSGGAGGGAILIVTPTIQLDGSISATGGDVGPGGSGGGIRLICDVFTGNGSLLAFGRGFYQGGIGYLRVETNSVPLPNINYNPAPSMDTTSATPQIWPMTTAPTVSIQSISGIPVPADPANILTTGNSVTFPTAGSYQVVISASNVPLTWTVQLDAMDKLTGTDTLVNATLQDGGTPAASLWTASVNMDVGFTVLQAHAIPGP